MPEQTVVVLGPTRTSETVREIIRHAAVVPWGTQVLRWRSCDVTYEGVTDHREALLPTALWHLRKRGGEAVGYRAQSKAGEHDG